MQYLQSCEVMPIALAHMLLMHPLHDNETVPMACQLTSFYTPSQVYIGGIGAILALLGIRTYHVPFQMLSNSVRSVPNNHPALLSLTFRALQCHFLTQRLTLNRDICWIVTEPLRCSICWLHSTASATARRCCDGAGWHQTSLIWMH